MAKSRRQSLIYHRQAGSVLLIAVMILGIVSSTIVMQYRYQARQTRLTTRLSERFIAQTMLNLSKKGQATSNFNWGQVENDYQTSRVRLKNGHILKFNDIDNE